MFYQVFNRLTRLNDPIPSIIFEANALVGLRRQLFFLEIAFKFRLTDDFDF